MMQPRQPEERKPRYHWRDLQLEDIGEYPTEEPAEPKMGERWYDPLACHLCIWDGIKWVLVPHD